MERRCETVGTAMPEVEVRVVDPETGEDCSPGVPGELLCRGYNIMKGYYQMPEATEKAVDADGWLHAGALGTVDGGRGARLRDVIGRELKAVAAALVVVGDQVAGDRHEPRADLAALPGERPDPTQPPQARL